MPEQHQVVLVFDRKLFLSAIRARFNPSVAALSAYAYNPDLESVIDEYDESVQDHMDEQMDFQHSEHPTVIEPHSSDDEYMMKLESVEDHMDVDEPGMSQSSNHIHQIMMKMCSPDHMDGQMDFQHSEHPTVIEPHSSDDEYDEDVEDHMNEQMDFQHHEHPTVNVNQKLTDLHGNQSYTFC